MDFDTQCKTIVTFHIRLACFLANSLVPDKLNSVLFWQKIENPHWGRARRNRQFSIVNIQLKTYIIQTLNFKLPF